MGQLHAGLAAIGFRQPLGGFIRVGGLGQGFRMLGGKSLALAQMKHIIIAEKGHVLFLLGFFVLHLEEFPENHHMGLFALADAAARLLNLLEGGVFARLTQQHLIQQGIGLAGGVADRLFGRDPRFLPWDDALLHLRKNPVCDFGVYVQFSLLPFLRGARRLW